MKRVSLAYAMYFKNKYDHSGNLLEGRFKNVTISTEEQLLYLTKYIHLNPSKLELEGTQPTDLSTYLYSSYPAYINLTPASPWLHLNEIFNLNYYQNTKNPYQVYKKFVENKQTDPEIISKLTLDN